MSQKRIPVTVGLIVLMTCLGCGSSETPGENVELSQREAAPKPVRRQDPPPPANTKRLAARDLLKQLEASGLVVQDLGAAPIHADDSSLFPEEPRSTLYLRVADGKGNASPMTFVEFGSWKAAAKTDAEPINGFAVRNWFVLGTVNNYFVGLLTEALSG